MPRPKYLRGQTAVSLYRDILRELACQRLLAVCGTLADIVRVRNAITASPFFPGGPYRPIGVVQQADGALKIVGAKVRGPTFYTAMSVSQASIWNNRSPVVMHINDVLLLQLVQRVFGLPARQVLEDHLVTQGWIFYDDNKSNEWGAELKAIVAVTSSASSD